MRKYMLVARDEEGNQSVSFYDTYNEAINAYMDCECGLGWYVELYSYMRENEDDPNEPESYICIM